MQKVASAGGGADGRSANSRRPPPKRGCVVVGGARAQPTWRSKSQPPAHLYLRPRRCRAPGSRRGGPSVATSFSLCAGWASRDISAGGSSYIFMIGGSDLLDLVSSIILERPAWNQSALSELLNRSVHTPPCYRRASEKSDAALGPPPPSTRAHRLPTAFGPTTLLEKSPSTPVTKASLSAQFHSTIT